MDREVHQIDASSYEDILRVYQAQIRKLKEDIDERKTEERMEEQIEEETKGEWKRKVGSYPFAW